MFPACCLNVPSISPGLQVGILTNPTAVTSDLQHIVDVLRAQPAVRVKCVFGPEHGFRGSAQVLNSPLTPKRT
jgi:uncharacterized protein YbbC (DUF1343 family)